MLAYAVVYTLFSVYAVIEHKKEGRVVGSEDYNHLKRRRKKSAGHSRAHGTRLVPVKDDILKQLTC